MKKCNMISSNKSNLRCPLKISDTIYLESNLNTDTTPQHDKINSKKI